MAWYNSSWLYRVKVTVLASKVDADLTDYPVYVDLANLPAGFHTNVNQTDARDIRVTTSDGTTEVPREVVFYTAASDTGELHFKASGTLSGSADTDFYIYYGNAAASEPAANATYGSQNVWNANYKAVYHFGSPATLSAADSTATAFNGTNSGTVAGTGKVGGAGSFDGTNDVITLPTTGSWDTDGNMGFLSNEAFSLQCWYKGSDTTSNTDFGTGLLFWNSGAIYAGFILRSGYAEFLHYTTGSGGWTHNIKSTTLVADDTWRKITYANTTSDTGSLYINGTAEVSAQASNILDGVRRYYQPYVIGAGYNNVYTAGLIDEMRIVAATLSATWESTEWNNQNSPSTFYTVGSQETESSGHNLLLLGCGA